MFAFLPVWKWCITSILKNKQAVSPFSQSATPNTSHPLGKTGRKRLSRKVQFLVLCPQWLSSSSPAFSNILTLSPQVWRPLVQSVLNTGSVNIASEFLCVFRTTCGLWSGSGTFWPAARVVCLPSSRRWRRSWRAAQVSVWRCFVTVTKAWPWLRLTDRSELTGDRHRAFWPLVASWGNYMQLSTVSRLRYDSWVGGKTHPVDVSLLSNSWNSAVVSLCVEYKNIEAQPRAFKVAYPT